MVPVWLFVMLSQFGQMETCTWHSVKLALVGMLVFFLLVMAVNAGYESRNARRIARANSKVTSVVAVVVHSSAKLPFQLGTCFPCWRLCCTTVAFFSACCPA